MYLIDTNVISIAAPSKKSAPGALAGWMDANSSRLFLSTVTVLEIEEGIAKVRREGAAGKADALASWLETVLHLYSDRIHPLGVDVARVAGVLSDKAKSIGRSPGLADIAIAATAIHHDLKLLTRNVKHFEPLGMRPHDPFLSLPQ